MGTGDKPATIGADDMFADEYRSFLDALARRYHTALRRFFERRAPGLSGESEDLTQEVFVRLAQRQQRGRIERIEGYLFETASNVLIDRTRRRATRCADRHDLYDEATHAIEDFSPERVLMAREEIEIFKSALQEMPDRVRTAFVLHRFEDLTYSEIAKKLGVTVSSVEKYIIRALREITLRMRVD